MKRSDQPPDQHTPARSATDPDCECGQARTAGHVCKPVHRQPADVTACQGDYARGAAERAAFGEHAVRYYRDR